jgi:hypothetical protein
MPGIEETKLRTRPAKFETTCGRQQYSCDLKHIYLLKYQQFMRKKKYIPFSNTCSFEFNISSSILRENFRQEFGLILRSVCRPKRHAKMDASSPVGRKISLHFKQQNRSFLLDK